MDCPTRQTGIQHHNLRSRRARPLQAGQAYREIIIIILLHSEKTFLLPQNRKQNIKIVKY